MEISRGNQRFLPSLRLRAFRQITRTLKEGRRYQQGSLLCHYLFSDESHPRVAFAVSSRVFRKAVDRNRIRRLMREAFRLNRHSLQGLGVWMVLRFVGKQKPDFPTLKQDLCRIFEHIREETSLISQ